MQIRYIQYKYGKIEDSRKTGSLLLRGWSGLEKGENSCMKYFNEKRIST
jgi:hypothetical protein